MQDPFSLSSLMKNMRFLWIWRLLRFTVTFLPLGTLNLYVYSFTICVLMNCPPAATSGILFPSIWLACKWELGREGETFQSIGFSLHLNWWRYLLLGILGGLSLLPLAFGVAAAVELIEFSWEVPALQDVAQQLGLVLPIGSLIALSEELLFRGFLLSVLCTRLSPLFSLIISSFLFGASHLWGSHQFSDLTWLIPGGMFLGTLYLKTRSLWPSIGAHAGYWYAIGMLSAFNVDLALPSMLSLDLLLAVMFGIGALVAYIIPLRPHPQAKTLWDR